MAADGRLQVTNTQAAQDLPGVGLCPLTATAMLSLSLLGFWRARRLR